MENNLWKKSFRIMAEITSYNGRKTKSYTSMLMSNNSQ